MSTTNFEDIRAGIVATVRDLIPKSRRDQPFRLAPGDEEFVAWAQARSPGSFRHFDIFSALDAESPDVHGTHAVYETMTAELNVAYPKSMGGRREGRRDLEILIDQDARQLRDALGVAAYGSYQPGQHMQRALEPQLLGGEEMPIFIVAISLELQFWRSVS